MRDEKTQTFKEVRIQSLYEDEELLVLDKPPGWIVNSAGTTTTQPVIQTWLEKQNYPIAKDPEFRSGIVHRLDKETSGCLIIAKTQTSFEKLQSQFKNRSVEKRYQALVHGILHSPEGEISASVGRLPWRRDRFGVLSGGRDAQTFYKAKLYYQKERETFTLVEAFPKTGRTHQIRIHMKYLGNPIVADSFYAGRKTARKDRQWCPRLFLHASYISFAHPKSGKPLSVQSELPDDLSQVLASMTTVTLH